ncbi:MAG: hypothetical protein ABJ239_09440 [Erythrobacter sp.]
MINLDGLSPGLTLFLWSAAVTPLFLAIQELRAKNLIWVAFYLACAFSMVVIGLFWPKLPLAASAVLSAGSDKIFLYGSIIWTVVYAIARRNWVRHGDRRLITGVGEGAAVFVFAAMILLPFLPKDAVAEIFSRATNGFIFVAGGAVGLILIWIDHDRVEKLAKRREKEVE